MGLEIVFRLGVGWEQQRSLGRFLGHHALTTLFALAIHHCQLGLVTHRGVVARAPIQLIPCRQLVNYD
ncbi:hypothetical protein OIU77_001553 [Salix suchowensis]|uniref:Uncharacterized protein n=1 Tax=Salix suchowensis TaxID=1278906 RepID=A0ABQ9B1U5_9ROSI|nr:hypothetical protein OIU77_001553 [Salix suchowensis]